MKLVCKYCGKDFEGRAKNTKYCSASCRRKNHYYQHPEKMKDKRVRENSDAVKRIYTRIKSRAKLNNIPFNLEIEDIVVPQHCPVLGIPIHSVYGGGTNQNNSPSVDRINPKGGYVKGNVRVISNRANLLKSNASIEELRLVLKDLEGIKKCD